MKDLKNKQMSLPYLMSESERLQKIARLNTNLIPNFNNYPRAKHILENSETIKEEFIKEIIENIQNSNSPFNSKIRSIFDNFFIQYKK